MWLHADQSCHATNLYLATPLNRGSYKACLDEQTISPLCLPSPWSFPSLHSINPSSNFCCCPTRTSPPSPRCWGAAGKGPREEAELENWPETPLRKKYPDDHLGCMKPCKKVCNSRSNIIESSITSQLLQDIFLEHLWSCIPCMLSGKG